MEESIIILSVKREPALRRLFFCKSAALKRKKKRPAGRFFSSYGISFALLEGNNFRNIRKVAFGKGAYCNHAEK